MPLPRVVLSAAVLIFLSATLFCSGCSTLPSTMEKNDTDLQLRGLPKPADLGAGQLVAVIGDGDGSSRARLYTLDGGHEGWVVHEGPIPAMVGRNGVAAPGEKVEGDGKTPSGVFPLEFVFGYDSAVASRMPYRQATLDDLWVDDAASPQYNTWVRRGETTANSFEVMRLPDKRYRHGIVIGYNRNPIVKGKGSAIFVHAWLEDGRPTAGCVSLEEETLVRLIQWLDPEKKPMVMITDGHQRTAAQ